VLANFDNKIQITSSTAKALDYLPEESLANQILSVDEAVGVKDAGLALRCLLSDGRLARLVTVKDEKTGKYRSETSYHKGKPVFLSTTTLVKFGVAIANRILFESVDQSPDQIRGALGFLATQASRPHVEDPQPDPYLTEFLNNSISNKQVLIPFLAPIAEKLPNTKTLIFRRYKQLEYLVKVSALIHWQQRVLVRVIDREYVVAHPVDFLYAR